jgi:hypothetical protein
MGPVMLIPAGYAAGGVVAGSIIGGFIGYKKATT